MLNFVNEKHKFWWNKIYFNFIRVCDLFKSYNVFIKQFLLKGK